MALKNTKLWFYFAASPSSQVVNRRSLFKASCSGCWRCDDV